MRAPMIYGEVTRHKNQKELVLNYTYRREDL